MILLKARMAFFWDWRSSCCALCCNILCRAGTLHLPGKYYELRIENYECGGINVESRLIASLLLIADSWLLIAYCLLLTAYYLLLTTIWPTHPRQCNAPFRFANERIWGLAAKWLAHRWNWLSWWTLIQLRITNCKLRMWWYMVWNRRCYSLWSAR